MGVLDGLNPKRVFEIFEEICSIPHGSGNMEAISRYCVDFAKSKNLEYICDEHNNVIIFKNATPGYENSDAVMIQGHMDMVCQKEADIEFDFEKQGIVPYIDGDFVKAKGTTLGGDNGIAVAMAMAVLEDDSLQHPALEVVFTIDEEVGLIGASKIDCSSLKSKKMINIDSEDPKVVIVSCAGGCDVKAQIPLKREEKSGKCIKITLDGLKGGHSGAEIDKGRINADILAGRILNHLKINYDFDIISLNGGDKGNAIPKRCEIELLADETVLAEAEKYLDVIKSELSDREKGFVWKTEIKEGLYNVISSPETDKIIYVLSQVPDGVMQMSASINGLVETSLNLGVLQTKEDEMILHFMLRSNKRTPLVALEERLKTFLGIIECEVVSYGHYLPWEFKQDSDLQEICKQVYVEQLGYEPEIAAIHAGLECGMFADKMPGLDCVSIGPELIDIHTTEERLSISSVGEIYECLLKILEKCK